MTWPRLIAASVILYLILAGALAFTKRPWADEAWFANTAVNIAENGKTGISVLDPRGNANMLGREFPGINREFYIWIPAQQAFYAIFYKLLGCTVALMRGLSIAWGLVVLAAWGAIVFRLTSSRLTAALALFLIATDFAFLDAASDGRMDIMCAGLSYGGLALYLWLREQHFSRAILASQACCVAAGLTHPMGAIGFLGLLFLTLFLDRRRWRWRHLGLAAAVYAAGVAVVAAYILPNLPLFQAQLGGALTGRLGVATSTSNTFWREITVKYASYYWPPYASGVSLLRAAIPLIYVLGLIGVLTRSSLRRSQTALLGLSAVALLAMAFLDSGKLYYYLVHSTPYFAVLLALWVSDLWNARHALRWPAAALVAALVMLHLGWIVTVVRKDPHHKSFAPMAALVQRRITERRPAPTVVMSSAELGFVTGFRPEVLVDDALLGYQSKRTADLIVVDERSYRSHLQGFEKRRPDVAQFMHQLLETYERIYSDGYYEVYERRRP